MNISITVRVKLLKLKFKHSLILQKAFIYMFRLLSLLKCIPKSQSIYKPQIPRGNSLKENILFEMHIPAVNRQDGLNFPFSILFLSKGFHANARKDKHKI